MNVLTRPLLVCTKGLASILFLSLVGCGQSTKQEKTAQTESSSPASVKAGDRSIERNKALVQVFYYGLGVFQFDRAFEENPSNKIVIHMPPATDHTKYLMAAAAEGSGYKWKIVPGGALDDMTVTFLPPSSTPLEALHTAASLGKVPSSSDEARDARWLIRSDQFGSIASFDPMGADSHVEFKAGRLETCGLVHEVGTIDKVCSVTTQAMPESEKQAASEYMVHRFVVDRPADFVIQLQPSSGPPRPIAIAERGGAAGVVFDGVEYARVFDILIANVDPRTTRKMESTHPQHIRDTMFLPNTPPNWAISSPDCSESGGVWTCHTCISNVQPACLEIFAEYEGAPGGMDRPICPIIEYP